MKNRQLVNIENRFLVKIKDLLEFILILALLFFFPVLGSAQVTIIPGTVDAAITEKYGFQEVDGPSVLKNEGYYVWGGSVVEGGDGKYHMFYSRWPKGPNHEPFYIGWLTDSEIAYAVSDYPDRGFEFVKVVLKGRKHEGKPDAWDAQSVHNPHVKKFGGNYYLYHIGSIDPGPQPEGSPGASLSRRNRIQQSQQIGIIEFENIQQLLDGDIERGDPLLSPRTRVKPDNIINPSPDGVEALPDNIIVVNPSVVYRPSDQKYLLYFKGNMYDPRWKGVHGVALSDHPTGPFEPLDQLVFNLTDDSGKIASAEDPYVWYNHSEEKFYAIFKDFTGQFTGDVPGLAMMISDNGIDWEKATNPLLTRLELKLESGDILPVQRLERPQLLLNDKGLPVVLYTACSITNPDDRGTFNVQIPLRVSGR